MPKQEEIAPTQSAENEGQGRESENHKFVSELDPSRAFITKAREVLGAAKQKIGDIFGHDFQSSREDKFAAIEDKYARLLEQEKFFVSHPDAELESLRSREYMGDAELEARLGALSEAEESGATPLASQKLLAQVVDSIDEETDFVAKLAETVKRDNLLCALKDGEYALPLSFGAKDFPDGAGVNTGKGIILGGEAPTPLNLLESLAKNGGQVGAIQTVHHELVHHLDDSEKLTSGQAKKFDVILSALGLSAVAIAAIFNKSLAPELNFGAAAFGLGAFSKLIKDWKKSADEGNFLTETHAYLSNCRLVSGADTIGIAKHLGEYYGLKKAEDVDKVFSASELIQQLYALGLNDAEIGGVVSQSKWDKEKKRWPLLAEKAESLIKEKNVSPEELDDFMRNSNLRSQIDNLKVKKITQDKIREATPDFSPESGAE